MKKRWIILIVLVLLILIGWYNFFVPHGSARRRLAEYKKELIAKGEKLDLALLTVPRRSSVSNVADSFLALTARWSIPEYADFPAAMKLVAPGAAAIGYTNLEASLMASYNTNKYFAAHLREILRGGSMEFQVDYPRGADTPLKHLAEIKRMALQLSDTAQQALHEHDLDEAALDLGAGADLLRLWGREPLLISTLLRDACAGIDFGITWEGLQDPDWNDAQLSALQFKWQQLNFFTNMDAVLSMERAFGIDGMAKARRFTSAAQFYAPLVMPPGAQASQTFGDWIGKLMKYPKAALGDVYERYPKFWMWKSKWSYEEELCGIQMGTAEVEACRRIEALGHCALTLRELQNQTSNILCSYPNFESHFMAGYASIEATIHRALVKNAQTEAAKRLLVIAISLKRYQLQRRRLPEKLDQLVPEFLDKVPIDFMDGKPLRYKLLEAKRFLLYSVGEDGRDDGGDGSPANASEPPRFLNGRDIVWPGPATEEQIRDYEAQHPRNKTVPPTSK